MSTYNRQPGDLAIQIYVPAHVGIEIGKLRLISRQTNNVIVTELITEALTARGLLTPEAPKKSTKPGPQVVMRNPAKSAAEAIVRAKAARTAERQLSLPVVVPEAKPVMVDVTVQDAVAVADTAETTKRSASITDAEIDAMFAGAGLEGLNPAPKPPARDTRTDEEKGFKFLDPNAPLDLSILTEVDEEEDPNPFAGFTPPTL